jgi:hypothetical protein
VLLQQQAAITIGTVPGGSQAAGHRLGGSRHTHAAPQDLFAKYEHREQRAELDHRRVTGAGSFIPATRAKSQGAADETGMNSVRPCTIPSKAANQRHAEHANIDVS